MISDSDLDFVCVCVETKKWKWEAKQKNMLNIAKTALSCVVFVDGIRLFFWFYKILLGKRERDREKQN